MSERIKPANKFKPDSQQLNRFNYTDIQITLCSGELNIAKACQIINSETLRQAAVIDIGGESIKFAVVEIGQGNIKIKSVSTKANQNRGINYYEQLVNFSNKINEEYPNIPVVISSAGVIKDGEILISSNFPNLIIDLQNKQSLQELFSKPLVLNDAQAAVYVGAYYKSKNPQIPNVKQFISLGNGGGLGVAFSNYYGKIVTTEASHIPAVSRLINKFDKFENVQLPVCGVFGRRSTCLEQISAIGQIEKLWFLIKQEIKSGQDIAYEAKKGDDLAKLLLENSADAMAHIVYGLEKCFKYLNKGNYTILLHGGGFEIDELVDNLRALLPDREIIRNHKDLRIENSSIAGAAIAGCLKFA